MYTRADLKTALNGRIHNKGAILPDINATINKAVREVYSRVDLRSSKMSESLVADLINTTYAYTCPTKLKANKIIGLKADSGDRTTDERWELTSSEEFDARKQHTDNLICIDDLNGTRVLRVSKDVGEATDYTVVFYSKYPWKTAGLNPTYKLVSTDDTDLLICDEDEFDMFVERLVHNASKELREWDDVNDAKHNYDDAVKEYRLTYKSEALPLQDTYYNMYE